METIIEPTKCFSSPEHQGNLLAIQRKGAFTVVRFKSMINIIKNVHFCRLHCNLKIELLCVDKLIQWYLHIECHIFL